jgi:hypothetical protein
MPTAIERFFRTPSQRSYLDARRILVCRSSFDPTDFRVAEISMMAQAGDYESLLEVIQSLDEVFALSTRCNFLGAVAATELGETAIAQHYKTRLQSCLRGVFATGDGSQRRPYQVTFLSDERDVLQSLGKTAVSQQRVETISRVYDMLECSDDTMVYFDISHLSPCRPPRRRAKAAVANRQPRSTRLRRAGDSSASDRRMIR